MRIILLIFSVFILTGESCAALPKGTIKNKQGEPLSFSTVYIKNTTKGVSANLKGEYFMELSPGTYTIVFSYLGYDSKEKPVTIQEGQTHVLNAVLDQSTTEIAEIEIVSNTRKAGKNIMKNVMAKRKFYLSMVENYRCRSYLKSSLQKELVKPPKIDPDSAQEETSNPESLKGQLKKEKLNLTETVSEVSFKAPGKFKEVIYGQHDYIEQDAPSGATVTIDFNNDDIIPQQYIESNPYILYQNSTSGDFNFYKNNIVFGPVCGKPILSPIASTAPLSYYYKFEESFFEDGKKIYKIEVVPRSKVEALFSGYIYIEDSTWAIRSVNLSINRGALIYCKQFQIIQDYEKIEDQYYLPSRSEFTYTIREGAHHILGNTKVHKTNYEVNVEFPDRFWNNEVLTYEDDAFDKDSSFWEDNRLVELKDEEVEFIDKIDSLEAYYMSDEYYHKIDSAFNRISILGVIFNGIGHRNRAKGYEFYIDGLANSIDPFGIGGYRQRVEGYFEKKFKSHRKLEVDADLNYGFNNNDMRGYIGTGLTYIPKKFVRTYVYAGDIYDQLNNFQTITGSLMRSNFVRKKLFGISQRMEIVNGLFGELEFNYSDQNSITDMHLSQWAEDLFGALNSPADFIRYRKSQISLIMKYRIGQKYIIKKGEKILLGSKYPEMTFTYKKGIPGLFGSEVNFDMIEGTIADELKLNRLGSSRWTVTSGTYLNKKSLRVLEHKYFGGSDQFFFSDPLQSYQLFDTLLHTRNEYLKGSYIHHFEGAFLNKVPLLNKLKLQLAGGAGVLLLRDNNLAHVEMFAGIEKPFRIKKELFRLGFYAVSANNSFSALDLRFKMGISVYNSFIRKWDY